MNSLAQLLIAVHLDVRTCGMREHLLRLIRLLSMDHTTASHPPIQSAAIFGASGGIGAALVEALAESGTHVWAGSRSSEVPQGDTITPFRFDLKDENSIEAAALRIQKTAPAMVPELVIVATGALSLSNGSGPERSFKKLDAELMGQIFQLNTTGPAIIAKHMLPLLPKNKRAVFAALSARVGSITDNRLGGWHSYRASKAALNMLLKNFAIELGRTHKHAVVAGLHPGTVDTVLSEPFQGNVPEGKLFTPAYSAGALLDVVQSLTPEDSGGVFDWAGARIEA